MKSPNVVFVIFFSPYSVCWQTRRTIRENRARRRTEVLRGAGLQEGHDQPRLPQGDEHPTTSQVTPSKDDFTVYTFSFLEFFILRTRAGQNDVIKRSFSRITAPIPCSLFLYYVHIPLQSNFYCCIFYD